MDITDQKNVPDANGDAGRWTTTDMITGSWYNSYGEVYGEFTAASREELIRAIAASLLDDGEWGTFGEDGDVIVVTEVEDCQEGNL